MSIINEALKKAQGDKRSAAEKTSPLQISTRAVLPRTEVGEARHPKPHKKFIFFILPIFIITAAVFFIKIYLPAGRTSPLPFTLPTLSSKTGSLPTLNLNGIVYDEENPCAIINNKVIREGDVIEGATLLEIKHDRVRLIFKDKEFELIAK